MGEGMYANRKTPSSSTPVPSGFVYQRPFPVPTQDTSAHPEPQIDLQAKLEIARRASPDLTTLKFSAPRPPAGPILPSLYRESLVTADQHPSMVQTKLIVGAPNDQYEQEADAVAAQVMAMPEPTGSPLIQQRESAEQTEGEEEPEEIQAKPLVDSIAPLIQRQPEDEREELQTAIAAPLQRETLPEADLQAKCEACGQEEQVQRVLRKASLTPDGTVQTQPDLESQLNSSKGGGSPLSDDVRSFMEPRFGADLSQVRVHTGSDAVQMNKDLNAQAFTHKQDIFFGAGKSPGKNDLTAHELTHVVQQTGSNTLQQKLYSDQKSSKLSLQTKLNPTSGISLQAKIAPLQEISNKDSDTSAKQEIQLPMLQLKCTEREAEDLNSSGNKEKLHTKFDSTFLDSAPSNSIRQTRQQSNKETLPNVQMKCVACESEEESEKTIQPKQIAANITPYSKDNKTIQKISWGDAKNAASSGAKWVGDKAGAGAKWAGEKAGQAADLGKEAFSEIVTRVAPGLADLIRQGPIGMLTEKIKEGVKGWVSGLVSGVNISSVIAGLKGSFTNVFETIKGAAKGDASSCAAFNQILESLQEMGHAFMNSPVMKEMQASFAKVGSVFKEINDTIISPAIDKVMQVAGSVVSGITSLATTIWEWGAPVRNAVGAAWEWVKKQLGIISDGAGGVLSWLKTKASEAWIKIQATLAPVIEPLKKVGIVLLAFSPVGLLAGAIKYGPQLIQAAQWLWAHRNDKDIVKHAREEMGNTILPQLLTALQGFTQGLQEAATGFVHHVTEISQAVIGLLSSITGVPILSVAQGAVQTLANDINQAVAWAQDTFQAAVQGAQELFTKIKNVVEPYKELLLSVGLAIANPAMIPAILAYNAWKLIPDCYKQSLFKFLYDVFLGKHGIFLNGWKKLQEGEAVFEAAAKVKLQALIDQIPDKTREAIETAMQKVSKPLQKHLKGIWSKLEPALLHLKANWWGEIKQMVWNLIWPFNEKSPLKKDVGELIHLPGEILKSIASGNISTAIDQFLLLDQKLNSVIGLFYGWFTIASILVGAIIGAFFGGAGALPGAQAGLAFAGVVGEELLIAMVATETAVIAKAVYDLAFGPESKQDSAYERIANSSLTLGITGVFVVLGELASEIASELVAGVKGLFKGAEGSEAGVKVNAPEIKGDAPEMKTDAPEVKGDTPEMKTDTPDIKGDKPEFETKTADGEHTIKCGKVCEICSTCEVPEIKYREELDANKDLQKKLDEINKIEDPAQKGLATKEFQKEAAEFRTKEWAKEATELKIDRLDKIEAESRKSLGKAKELLGSKEVAELRKNPAINKELQKIEFELKQLEDQRVGASRDAEALKELKPKGSEGEPAFREECDHLRENFDDIRARAEELKGKIDKTSKPESKFDNQAFLDEIKKLGTNERIARIEEQAGKIASQKGFERDPRLSRINNRTVYRDPATGDLYGVDTETGSFEKCNPRGIHQGEFNFADVEIDPADPDGGHDLRLN